MDHDQHHLLEDSPFLALLRDLPMTCVDVGARSGFTSDLLSIAESVDAVGFEPDAEECDRLNQSIDDAGHPWRSLRFVPVALAGDIGERILHLYRQRGCSSLLEADRALASLYARGDYYIEDGTATVRTTTLAAAAAEHGFEDLAFLKLDIQGLELEVLNAATALLEGPLLALRLEVSFVPMYRDQPLWCDIDCFLRPLGFVPMHFPELHHWRRSTRVKHPRLAKGPMPYSRGQIIHGDVVYFRHPETMPDDSDQAIGRLIRAALLAITYEHIDHAAAILARPPVTTFLRDRYGIDAMTALAEVSQRMIPSQAAPTKKKTPVPAGAPPPDSVDRGGVLSRAARAVRRVLGGP